MADAYDAMSSNRSYRDAMPQQIVREEIVKGAGTQFDPEMAKIMQHLIDLDSEYTMKERVEVKELAGRNELICGQYREEISEGIPSEDGMLNGKGYHECALIRLDGENWDTREDEVKNELTVEKTDRFISWDDWKEQNRKGFDCKISFEKKGNRIIMATTNQGISIRNVTYLNAGDKVYTALTGDQVALTDIRIVGQ